MLSLRSEDILVQVVRKKMSIKTYSELIALPTFEERFRYLKLDGTVGKETFGFKRRANQEFYHSQAWRSFRSKIIIRDLGCDLGVPGFEIYGSVLIHHLNPVSYDDIVSQHSCIFDPENVICTKLSTHNAIHYGDEDLLIVSPTGRSADDTCPWKRK